jgi:hypothetical protein
VVALKSRRTITYLVPVLYKLLLGESSGVKAVKLFNQWIRESGVEWTCKRLKALRTGAIQLRAGSKDLAVEVWRENSISYNKSTGYPKGVFGKIVQQYVDARRPSSVRRMDTLLRVYTAMYCKSLSKGQDGKAYKAITSDHTAEFDQRFVERISRSICRMANRHVRSKPVKVGRPNLAHLKAAKSCHIPFANRKLANESSEGTIYAKMCMSLVSSTWLPEDLARINPCEELRSILMENGADSEIAGHVAFIQEGGCKARVVAVPNAWIQWLMEPLHAALDRLVQELPESTVHDQNNGAYFMQEHISKGSKLWCFDLSSATDRFPIELQLAVLEGLGLEAYARAFKDIANAKWEYYNSFHREIVSYKVGQPMGVYGSFPLFHLTHYFVLKYLCFQSSIETGRELGSCFCVQGDDIVISDADVADRYEKTMTKLGVELSPVKTISSRLVGEFAGFITTYTNRADFAFSYRPYKYVRPLMTKEPRLFNLCASMGRSYKLLKGRVFRKVDYDTFAGTLPLRNPDLSPILSEDDSDEGGFPIRLDQQLLGATLNRACTKLSREMNVDRHTWRSWRRVLLGDDPLPDELLSGNVPYSNYSERVKAGLVRDPLVSGVSSLEVTSDMKNEKDFKFGTRLQRDHLYYEEEADRSRRKAELEGTSFFGE